MEQASRVYRNTEAEAEGKKLSIFEKYLTLWVFLCIVAGIILGRALPDMASVLDRMSVAQVSIPIAICLFFMMYPIMVKIDFSEVIRAGKTPKPVLLTLFANWVIKPFTMVGIATFSLAFVFKQVSESSSRFSSSETLEVPRWYYRRPACSTIEAGNIY
jgi:ACR3 family arsenite transporter